MSSSRNHAIFSLGSPTQNRGEPKNNDRAPGNQQTWAGTLFLGKLTHGGPNILWFDGHVSRYTYDPPDNLGRLKFPDKYTTVDGKP